MFKKIATKSLVIFLATLILFFSTITPMARQISSAAPLPVGTDLLGGGNLLVQQGYVYQLAEPSAASEKEVKSPLCSVCISSGPSSEVTGWGWITGGIDWLLSLIPMLLVLVIKWLLMLFATILMWLMVPSPDNWFWSFSQFSVNSPFVIFMWEIAKNYANLLITLFLIWIAINIILGKKEYTNYQYLIRLLVIALLLNFSLVICGLFISISNYLTFLFMSSMDGSGFSCLYTCVVHTVANAFETGASALWFPLTIGNVIAATIGIVFLGQLAGLVIYVAVRMVTLWFLVGVSPIAIVLSATPKTEKLFQEWLNHFITNLVNLPVLALASFFVISIMLNIADTFTKNVPGPGQILQATIGFSLILIILAQALLMVSQKLNVSQVTMATSKITSWAKAGTKLATKPTGKFLTKTVMQSKPMQGISSRLKSSKFATMANIGNTLSSKAESIQKGNASNLKHLHDNANWRALERQAKNRDPYIAAQALDYLATLDKAGDYEAKSGQKLTEDTSVINQIFNTSKNNSTFKDSGVFGSLKKKLPHFGYGANKIDNPADFAQNLASLLIDPEKRKNVNLKSTFDVMLKTAGDKLPELMASLQKSISPGELHSLTSTLNPTAYKSLMETISKGIIVASKAKINDWNEQKINNALSAWDPAKNDVQNNLASAAKSLTGDEYNWFGKYGGTKKNMFADKAIRWGVISRSSQPTSGTITPPAPVAGKGSPTPVAAVPTAGGKTPTPTPTPPTPVPATPPVPAPVAPTTPTPDLNIDALTTVFQNETKDLYSQLTDKISNINLGSTDQLQKVKKTLQEISLSQKEISKNILSNTLFLEEYSKQLASAKQSLSSHETASTKEVEDLKEILTDLTSAVNNFSKKVKPFLSDKKTKHSYGTKTFIDDTIPPDKNIF